MSPITSSHIDRSPLFTQPITDYVPPTPEELRHRAAQRRRRQEQIRETRIVAAMSAAFVVLVLLFSWVSGKDPLFGLEERQIQSRSD